jgi:phage shock protein A
MSLFARMYNQIRGRISLFFSSLEFRNPEVLLENAKEDLRRNRVRMQNGVAQMAAVSERLRRQIADGERRKQDLEGRIMVMYNAGKEELAAELAEQLQQVEADLAENRQEFDSNESAYKEFVGACQTVEKETRKKIEKLTASLSKAKAKEAMAEVSELLSGTVTQQSASLDNMQRLEEVVTDKLDKASGRVRAAQDTSQFGDIKLKQQEQEISKKAALANFLARKNIAMAPKEGQAAAAPAPTPTAEKPKLGESA